MIDPLCSLQIKLNQKCVRLHVSTLDLDARASASLQEMVSPLSSESQG